MRPPPASCLCLVAVASALSAQEPADPDPALHRGFAMETGWTQRGGHGAGTLMLMLATPMLDYGITDRVMLLAGLPLPVAFFTAPYLPVAWSLKAGLLDLPALHGAAGVFGVTPGGAWPYLALTAGTPRASLSATLSPWVWVPRDEARARRETVVQALAAVRLGSRAKLLIEGLYLDRERWLLGAGLRLYRAAFVLELAGGYDPQERRAGPWISLAWAW